MIAAWFPGIQAGPALVRTLYGEQIPAVSSSAGLAPLDKSLTNAHSAFCWALIQSCLPPLTKKARLTLLASTPTARSSTEQPDQLKTLNASASSALNKKAHRFPHGGVTNSVQLRARKAAHVRLEGTSTAQPVRALKGFQRVSLAPGETKKVTFNLAPEAFALWSIDNQFTVEAAKATVWISPNSAAGTGTPLEIPP